MKVGGQKVGDIEKQIVRRLGWDGKVPGTSMGTRATETPSQHLTQDPWMRAKSTAPSLAKQGGQSGTRIDQDA